MNVEAKPGVLAFFAENLCEIASALERGSETSRVAVVEIDPNVFVAEIDPRNFSVMLSDYGKPVILSIGKGTASEGLCRIIELSHLAFASEETEFEWPTDIEDGNSISQNKAVEIGLVNENPEGLDHMAASRNTAERIALMAPLAVRAVLESASEQSDENAGFERELELFSNLFSTRDMRRGTEAFLNKKEAEFFGD
ncbi:MAG: hypothetical protein R2684_14745 [Pyrinomonadaceae bacterium]